MIHRVSRFLLLWCFVALQAMVPFIHAHAGSVQFNHVGFLHLHQGAASEATSHVAAYDTHGTEVDVAEGVRLRVFKLSAHSASPVYVLPPHPLALPVRPASGLSEPPLCLEEPDHTFPLAMAPPSA